MEKPNQLKSLRSQTGLNWISILFAWFAN